jgi:glycosyltransferase involved in cell wall biosynthesis
MLCGARRRALVKRIGVVLTAGPGGGSFQYSQTILEAAIALPRDKYSIVAAYRDALWLEELDEFDSRATAIQLNDSSWNRGLNRAWHLTRLPMSAWRRSAARLDTNIRALRRADCDLWVCPNHDRYAFRSGLPTLGTVHDLMHRYEPSFPEVSENGEFERREFHFRETCRWSKGVLVDSEVGKQQLRESYAIPDERVFVLPFIAPRYIRESPAVDDATFDARYNLPPKFFFYPAQFYRHKNHRALVEAVALMKPGHPDVRVVFVGAKERNGYDDVRSLVAARGLDDNVLFMGYVPDDDMPGFYRRARALVMPTFFGPTNIPQLEAFAIGCPVATSRIYGIPEQVGDAALLFDPASVEEIHDCLLRLWRDNSLCADLAERGRERSRSWGPQQFAARFEAIIARLT